jgi:tight adherence protein B
MIPAISPFVLLVSGLVILVGFGFSGFLVARAEAQNKRLLARRDQVLLPHRRNQTIDIRLFARPANADASLAVRTGAVFGIDLERADICPLPWWSVLAAALLISYVILTGLAFLLGSLVWLGSPAIWIGVSRFLFHWFKGRRRAQLLLQFPDALMMIVRAVRVGVPVGEAIHIVAHEQPQPTAGEFARVASQLAIGEPLEKAIMAMARHAEMAEYRFFATALTLQSKAGGALSGTLEGLAEMIRKRVAVKQRAHALASEARMSIYVLAGLPVFVAGGLAVLAPDFVSLLITDPLGNKFLVAAIMSLLTGITVMQIIVKKSVS